MPREVLAHTETIAPWEQSELTAVLRLRHDPSPENHERLLDECASDGAELLDAPMITRYQFKIVNGKTVDKENEPLTNMWSRGTTVKQKRALQDSRYWLDYERAKHEENEQIEFDEQIIPSFVYNTQVTFTPYPQDMENAHGRRFIETNTYYKPDRKFGLIRILYQTSPDTVELVSISVENSHYLVALAAVANSLGHKMPEGLSPTDWLGQHIKTYVSPEQRFEFEGQLIAAYDHSLSAELGGNFYQGRPKEASIEAYAFVLANQDLLGVYMKEMSEVAASGLEGSQLLRAVRGIRRPYLIALHRRHQQGKDIPIVVRQYNQNSHSAVRIEMNDASRWAVKNKFVPKGACTVLDNEQDADESLLSMSENEFKQMLLSETDKRYEFDQEMYCVVCQAPPKPEDKKKKCGPCGICQPCDKELRSKEARKSTLKAA